METLHGTFERIRPKLERQYLEVEFDPATGVDGAELTRLSDAYVNAHPDEPVIRTRAALLELVLTRGRIGIDPDDWFADHLATGDGIRHFLSRRMDEVQKSFPESEEHQRSDGVRSGCFDCWLDLSHTTPDWKSILSLGVCGLRDRALAAEKSAKSPETLEFFRAVSRVFEAMRIYLLRLAELAEKKGAIRVAPVLRALSERPPESFHEALQLAYLYHEVQEIEGELVRSMGCFDRLYIDFYRRDIEKGVLTRDQAKELLKFFWIKFYARTQGLQAGKNFCFGGLLPDGSDAVNELTVLAYETYREMRVVDPKLTMRVHSASPEAMLLQVAECLKSGLTATVFMNDDVLFPLFLKRGKSPEDVYDYVAIGCYEPAIMGREMCCSMTIIFNLVKPLELLLHGGEDPATGIRLFDVPEREFHSFESFFNAYLSVLKKLLMRAMHIERLRTATWSRVNPSPLLSGTMPACIASGRDVSEAGTKYNQSGVMCAAIGSVADSLFAVKKLVFEEKRCSLGELAEILRSDWAGHEELRLYARTRLPKWGNNCTELDEFARIVTGFAADLINHEPNGKGGSFQMGLWSIDHNRSFGRMTGALPDGRRAGEELSKNVGSSAGMDRRGVTALINSAGKLDHTSFPDGSVLDITLHPSAVSGEDGAKLIVDLVRTYFEKGGQSIQFNIFDAETLRKARQEPEKYANLQVRVCGWNARFIDLSPEAQESFIAAAGGGGSMKLSVPIAEVKRMAVHDGPGVRTTVFVKGCPLHCLWCHNPECISARPEIMFRAARCTGCRRCEAVCPNRAHRIAEEGHHIFRRELCTACGACAGVCFSGALTLCGKPMTPETLLGELLEDVDFYRVSGGGVTISGGEPLLYPAFCLALFRLLGREKIHRALDTSAAVPWEAFERVLPECDLLLIDFKHPDPERHRALTGMDNRQIRENLRRLQAFDVPIEIRIPLVPGYNDSPRELEAAAEFLDSLPRVTRVRVLAYHSFARSKYAAVGRRDTMPQVESPSRERVEAVEQIFRANCA